MNIADKINVADLISKGFNRDAKQLDLYHTDIAETEDWLFIATHRIISPSNDMHEYFMLAVYKPNFNEVVYKSQNCIDADVYKTAEDAKRYAKNHLNHLLSNMDFDRNIIKKP